MVEEARLEALASGLAPARKRTNVSKAVRRLGWLLAIFVLTVGALVAGTVIDLAWNHRAADICNQEAEKPAGATTASGYSIQWEWTEFAYVCTYHAPGQPRKRVGFTHAFL
jgi:hypothetical protein